MRVAGVSGVGQVEHGSWASVRGHERVLILAHWSDSVRLSRSVAELLGQFRLAGFATVLVSTTEDRQPLLLPRDLASLVIRRPNQAYDFGSWAYALRVSPWLAAEHTVVLANDSLAGPFDSLAAPLHHMSLSQADVWGLVSSAQFGWHLQSFFMRFAPGVLSEGAISRFWSSVTQLDSKADVIREYELGLSRLLLKEAFQLEAFVPAGTACDPADNPMIVGWRGVLDRGVPLVKRELLRMPELAPDGFDLAAELRRRFGVTVDEWL